MDHTLRSTGIEWTYLVCLVKLLTNWVLSLSSSAFLNFLPGWTWHLPVLLEDLVLCAIANKNKQTPALVALRYQIQCGVVIQREHTGDEWGCGQRAPKEYPSRESFFVCLSRFSLNQDKLPILLHAWMCCVCSWWFSPPAVATGEVAWLERVQVGQKTEMLVSELCQPFILSSHANDILFSLFSVDEIALYDFLRPFELL